MSFRTDFYPLLDELRSLAGPSEFDIRLNQLTIRTRTWSGTIVGEGTSTDSDLVLPAHYPVRFMTAQEISSAAGEYEVSDLLVDHITPFDGVSVGYTKDQLRPQPTSDNVEIIYILTGSHAGDYHCMEIRNYKAFTTQLVLRRRGETP
jgi:hypothetical protein